MSKYAEVVSINSQKIDKKYVASLDKQGRENLVEPLFNHFRNQGHQDALVAFSTLSPNQNGNSVYIIGKALYKRFAGISEYADIVAYQQAIASGVKKIDMGQAPKNLLKYKMKYPGASIEVSYDGKILEVI